MNLADLQSILNYVVLSMFFCSTIYAAPFMVCDPQENVTSYIVTMNGTSEEVQAQDLEDNTTRLYYDLEGIVNGVYDCNVTARSMWGDSEPVPFSFSKTMPGCPSVLDIVAQ